MNYTPVITPSAFRHLLLLPVLLLSTWLGAQCPPVSPDPCGGLDVTLPYSLAFTGSEGGLDDAAGSETGFTLALEHSEARMPEDLPITDPQINGYEPGKLDVTSGNLVITAGRGIAFRKPGGSSNNNNQINTLGVGFTNWSSAGLDVETKVLTNNTGGASAQNGLWFGLDEDNFVKLVAVSNNQIELRIETNGNSVNTDAARIQVPNLSLTGKDVTLRLRLDPVAGTIAGYYRIDGGAEVLVANTNVNSLALPQSFVTGRVFGTEPAMSLAGVFATYRNGSVFDATFDYFSITPEVVTPDLTFAPGQLTVTAQQGETIPAQQVTLSASDGGTPAVTLSDDPDASGWLILPTSPAVGQMQFDIQPNLPVGNYSTTIFATATGYETAQLDVTVSIAANEPEITVNTQRVILDAVVGASRSATIQITNTGMAVLNNPTATLSGAGASTFTVNTSSLPASIPVSGTASLTVTFDPVAEGSSTATLSLGGDQADAVQIELRGLGKDGTGGSAEPSLQYIFDTYGLAIAVGDADAATNQIDLSGAATYNDLLGDEVAAPLFTRAGTDPVTVEVLSVFGPEANDPIVAFGWYPAGQPATTTELFTVSNAVSGNGQTLNPVTTGTTSFDPGTDAFGLFSRWPFFNNRQLYSEDALNTFSGSIPHHVRVYPMPGESNAYIVATEEHTSGYDYQDIVVVVRNVDIAATPGTLRINYSNATTPPPTGYLRDHGQAYGNRGNWDYGWVVPGTSTPLSLVGNGRNRDPDPDLNTLSETLMHMQYGDTGGSNGISADGAWEVALTNGSYRVTVQAGDTDNETLSGTHHLIRVEGTTAIDEVATQGAPNDFSATVDVVVSDGRLTVDASGGFNSKIKSLVVEPATTTSLAYFSDPDPADGTTNVPTTSFQIAVNVNTPTDYELDKASMAGNVKLFEQTALGPVAVPANFNDTGGGDAIVLTPNDALKPSTTYQFQIDGVEANRIGDLTDRITFTTFISTFTTNSGSDTNPPADLSGVSFTQVKGTALGQGVADRFSSLVIGPDGKLYASTTGEIIKRWTIESDGTLSNLEELTINLTGANHPVTGDPLGNDRLIIGLTFAPDATAQNLVAYVTHSAATLTAGPEWDGALARLSGPNLGTVENVLVHLPRSVKDHLTNSVVVGEDGDLFIVQGSNTAGGDPDASWGFRPERLLAAAVLRLEMDKLPAQLPLSVYTTDDITVINNAPATGLTMSDGTYNPYSADSPLTLYATGVRNAYDMVFHTNGWLYIPTNGTAGNNSTSPVTPASADYVNRDASGKGVRRPDGTFFVDPNIPGVVGGETQKDWLFKSLGGSYHGHPNPYRGEFVLNHGGQPYSGLPGQPAGSYTDVAKYPDNLGPDPNYLEVAYDFLKNKSPNGAIEYRSNAFNGIMQGMLLVVRFSGQDDIIVMQPGNTTGDIIEVFEDVPGLQGYDDPLDVVEDTRTGNLYMAQYDRSGNNQQLILMRADVAAQPEAVIAANPEELLFEVTVNTDGDQTSSHAFSISNTGSVALDITNVALTGPFASQFSFSGPLTVTLAPASAQSYSITYAPALDGTDLGHQEAALTFTSNGNDGDDFAVGLHGLKKAGHGGSEEPPLQEIVDALGIGIDVGWTGLTGPTTAAATGDEVLEPLFVAAGTGQVEMIPVARYSPAEALPFGWYTDAAGNVTLNEIGTQADGGANAQTLYPGLAMGAQTFDPQGAIFGLYLTSGVFNRTYYTEDGRNTGSVAHRVRVYPAKDRGGVAVPNSYLLAFEDAANGDYQDYVFLLTNAKPYVPVPKELDFAPDALAFQAFVGSQSAGQTSVLSATTQLNASQVSLQASETWVNLPSTFTLGASLEFSVDATSLVAGTYQATVTATAPDFAPATLNITATVAEPAAYSIRINFQDNTFTPPSGYVADIGEAYGSRGNGETFGWVSANTGQPLDNTDQARGSARGVDNASSDSDKLLRSHNMMDKTSLSPRQPADWAIAVPNGRYRVEVAAGDPSYFNSQHTLRAEGVVLIDDFVPTASNFYQIGFDTVDVFDGMLNIDDVGAPTDGNVKIIYADITSVETGPEKPIIVASYDGLQNQDGDFRDSVQVTLSVTDRSGTGIQSVLYAVDGGAFQSYATPFWLYLPSGQQSYTFDLDFEATDNSNLTGTTQEQVTVARSSNAILRVENMTKLPGSDRSFPAADYFTFHRVGSVVNRQGQVLLVKDTNIVRLHNDGTEPLILTEVTTSDTEDFTVTGISIPSGGLTVPPNGYVEGVIRFVTSTGTNARLVKRDLVVQSNADNYSAAPAVLHGAYMVREEGGNELDILQVWEAHGFTTQLGLKSNGQPETRPGSNRPTDEQVDNGSQGDMILPAFFEQADTTKPVQLIQLAAFHGPGDARMELVKADSTTAGDVYYNHHAMAYQTFLPRIFGGGLEMAGAWSPRIRDSFQIEIATLLSSGSPNNLLGIRMYRARDRDGNIIPNEYLITQDYIGGGCGPGSANCDWNDNMGYLTNARPLAKPAAHSLADVTTQGDVSMTLAVDTAFTNGYPGNRLRYSANLADGSALPNWMNLDGEQGVFTMMAPRSSQEWKEDITVTATDPNEVSAAATFTLTVLADATALPIELLSFEGRATDDHVELEWTTLYETDNEYFELQRSADGRVYTSIGEVAGAGTSTEQRQYGFRDRDPEPGSNYYRLKQVDFDGTFTLSKVVHIAFTDELATSVQLFPNPTHGQVTLEFSVPSEGGNIEIYDPSGRRVFAQPLQVGDRRIPLDVSGLMPGAWFVKVSNGSSTQVLRLLKQ
jgi:hypothetical protein